MCVEADLQVLRRDRAALANELPRGVRQELADHQVIFRIVLGDARQLDRIDAAIHLRGLGLRVEHFCVALRIRGESAERRADHAAEARGELREVIAEEVVRSEEHTSELQSLAYLVCRLLLEKK